MDTLLSYTDVVTLRHLAGFLQENGFADKARNLGKTIRSLVACTGAPGHFPDDQSDMGVCPLCGECEEWLNIGRDHYGVCHEHRVAWCFGSNLFSTWRHDTEEVWAQNASLLKTYRIIDSNDAVYEKTCPCCGLATEHAAWCSGETQESLDELLDL